MHRGLEHDYYTGTQDKELNELLEEWNSVVESNAAKPNSTKKGAARPHNASVSRSPSDSLPSSTSQPSSSVTSVGGSAFTRHHRYIDHTIAYRQSSDPYESAEEAERAAAFRSKQLMMGKPFEAAGRGNTSRPTRVLLGDCVRELFQAISHDWVDANPVIITTAEDLIVIYFRVGKQHHRELLRRYMNGCLLRNMTCRQYDLRKVPEGWNRETEDGCIMFTARPLWVSPQRFLPPQKAGA